MIATEMAPLAKVGGLADVVGALPQALARLGHEVRVVLPRYQSIDAARHGIKPGPGGAPMTELAADGPRVAKVTVHLIENEKHFGRPGIYNDPKDGRGYPDNAERFIFFQRAALSLLKEIGFKPDVIHCHDHQTALIPAYLRMMSEPFFSGTGTLFTVHNLGYQGLFPPETMEIAGFDRSMLFTMGPFEFYGQMNFMKAGLALADLITTVSPTYAREICSPDQGAGLDGVLQSRRADLHGVLNGIDDSYWNPSKDQHLKNKYSVDDLSGKNECRKTLLKEMGISAGKKRVPVIGIISRLTEQKGFDLLEKVIPALMERDLMIVALGAGEERYVNMLQDAQLKFPKKVALRVGFDEALAHLIEAGSDMFLMPSRYEPCGLNQMYSLAYGTVPVVRATGGLADTVREQGSDDAPANGFVFDAYDDTALHQAITRALDAFADKKRWTNLMKAGMRGDYSWARSARLYEDLYKQAKKKGSERAANSTQVA